MQINYINYATLGMMKKNQVGSSQTTITDEEKNEFNYKNGLSVKELAVIDVNSDGAITEEEFKTAFCGSTTDAYKAYWESYSQYYNAKTNQNGITTQEKNNIQTESVFEGDKMIGYTQTKINKDGSTEIKYFTFNEQTKTYDESAKETRFVDGSYVIKNADGSEEYKWKNGNHEIFNKYGKPEIISTTIDDEKITYEIEYDDKGIPTSITVGDRKYTDVILVDDNEQIYDPSKPGLNINEFKHIFVREKSEDDKTEYPISLIWRGNGKFDLYDNTLGEEPINVGYYKEAEIEENIYREGDTTIIQRECHGRLLSQEVIKMEDGEALENYRIDISYHVSGNRAEEIVKDYVTGCTTKSLYEDGSDTPYYICAKDKKGRIIDAQGTLEGVLKTKYPNLSRVQIKQLVEECATLNNIDPDSIITFDTSINNFNINIPKYKIDRNTDKLIFVYEN